MNIIKLTFSTFLICLLTACGGNSNNNSNDNSNSSSSLATTTSSFQMTSSSAMSSLKSSSSIAISSSTQSSKSAFSDPIRLSYGSNNMQFGELRLPQLISNEPVPLVIIIHGGCWVSSIANYQFMDAYAQAITNLGYATWNIEYRALGTGGDWPIIFQDINKAIDYSRTLAQNYAININKVAIIGHSAGGHLALWAASRKNLKNDSLLYTENPLSISGVISLAGIANVTGYNTCGGFANNVIGVAIAPSTTSLTQRLLETSPLQMLPIQTKTILISGSADGIVPPPMGTQYSEAAINQGDNSTHHILQGLGHFDLIDPANSNWTLHQQSLQNIFKD